jgi:DNA (cytosine-5)-methyltransferase 3A
MKVLSLFDGMSCGRIALDQLGIPVETYYASEIDKYAIQVSQANYPDIIQVGDICDLDPKDYMDVDLMLAGSPCQGFSFAGKQLAFDDPRSALFFEFIRLLKAIKPKYFLLENVRMKKEFLQVISQQVSECYPEIPFGIEPIFINSSLVSAQSRQRYYWTNIPRIKQPEERGIVLRDILEDNYDSERDKAHCIDANYYKGANVEQYKTKHRRQLVHKPMQVNPSKKANGKQPYIQDRVFHEDGKSHSLTASFADRTNVATRPIKVGMNVEQVKIRKHEVDIVGLQQCILSHYAKCGMSKKEIAKELNDKYSTVEHYFRNLGSEYFAIPSDEHWPQLKEILNIKTDKYDKSIMEFEYRDGVFESTQRVYSEEGKSPTLTASNTEQMIETKPKMVGRDNTSGHDILKRVYSEDGKSPTITAHAGKGTVPKVETKPKKAYVIPRDILKDNERQRRVYDPSGKSPTILGRSDSPKITSPKQVGTAVDINGHDILKRVYSPDGKSPTVTACSGGNNEPKVVTGGAIRGRAYDKDGKRMDKDGVSVANKTTQMLELRKDNKTNAITTVAKDSVVVEKSHPLKANYYKSSRANFENDTSKGGKFSATGVQQEDLTWRKLTPLECERLQTVPDNYTNHVSNTQRYKMLGNGWTVEVIKHIFNNMEY